MKKINPREAFEKLSPVELRRLLESVRRRNQNLPARRSSGEVKEHKNQPDGTDDGAPKWVQDHRSLVLPKCYGFYPTDEQLLLHFLQPFTDKPELTTSPIHFIDDVYSTTPQILTGCYENGNDRDWFFISQNKLHQPTSVANRIIEGGVWKKYVNTKKLYIQEQMFGWKRIMHFHDDEGIITDWRMDEISLKNKSKYIVSKIYREDKLATDDFTHKSVMKKQKQLHVPEHDEQLSSSHRTLTSAQLTHNNIPNSENPQLRVQNRYETPNSLAQLNQYRWLFPEGDQQVPDDQQAYNAHQNQQVPDDQQAYNAHQNQQVTDDQQAYNAHQNQQVPYDQQAYNAHQNQEVPYDQQAYNAHQNQEVPYDQQAYNSHQNQQVSYDQQAYNAHQNQQVPYDQQAYNAHQNQEVPYDQQAYNAHQNQEVPYDQQAYNAHQNQEVPYDQQAYNAHQNQEDQSRDDLDYHFYD